MAKPFRSEFGDNAKLVACADQDRDNIWEGNNRNGAHVALIHKALNAWRGRQANKAGLPEIPAGSTDYGLSTSQLVLAYKKAKGIKNYKGEFDPIVGKKTVVALDDELPIKPDAAAERKKKEEEERRKREEEERRKAALRPLDVVLMIHGIPPTDKRAGKKTDDDPFDNVADFTKAANSRGKARDFVVVNMYGAPGMEVVDTAEALFNEAVAGRTIGLLIVVGSSVGGTNAAHFVHRIKNVEITYAAFLDAAFDSPSDPILSKRVTAKKAQSIYQTMTYSWADLLGSPEFHGQIIGTEAENVTYSARSGQKNRQEEAFIDMLRREWTKPRLLKYYSARICEKRVHDRAVYDGWEIAGKAIVKLIEEAP